MIQTDRPASSRSQPLHHAFGLALTALFGIAVIGCESTPGTASDAGLSGNPSGAEDGGADVAGGTTDPTDGGTDVAGGTTEATETSEPMTGGAIGTPDLR